MRWCSKRVTKKCSKESLRADATKADTQRIMAGNDHPKRPFCRCFYDSILAVDVTAHTLRGENFNLAGLHSTHALIAEALMFKIA
jgi:hypothetical protein